MIVLLATLPIIAYLSTVAFYSMNLTVVNYESKWVPYSLGAVVLYSYAILYTFPPQPVEALSFTAYLFVVGVWLLGLIDDLFGKPYPKGIRGHLLYAKKMNVMTTGLLKAFGTIALALFYLLMKQPGSVVINIIFFLLLTGLPHVLNLFDTKPLRVWKVALCMTVLIFIVSPLPSFLFVMTLLAVFYVSFVIEGRQKAMLGDNGATTIGAIIALVIINQTVLSVQLFILLFVLFFIVLAEKKSISTIIEQSRVLKAIDQIGLQKK